MIFGIKKFHQYLYGQKFKIFTYHKLFKADKAVPAMASREFNDGLYIDFT